jgi:hypothetical protein
MVLSIETVLRKKKYARSLTVACASFKQLTTAATYWYDDDEMTPL